jgi:hypothetical protein
MPGLSAPTPLWELYNKSLINTKMKKIILFSALVTVLLAGCSNEETTSVPGKELGLTVKIGGTSATRSLVDAFSSDDQIGVFVAGTGYTSKVAAYTLSAGIWNSPTLESGKIFLTGNTATVYSFFPSSATYDMSAKTITTIVPSYDDFAATAATDFMYGQGNVDGTALPIASNMTAAAAKPDLYFFHALTKISFIVNKASSYPSGTDAGKLTKIQLSNTNNIFALEGTTSLTNGVFTPTTDATKLTGTITLSSASAVNINEYATTASTTVSAFGLVAPCTNLTGTTLSLTIDGKVLSGTIPSTVWSKGKNYIYTVTVSGTELNIGTVTIVDWTDENVTIDPMQ